MTRAALIFVSGVKPKPAVAIFRRELCRVLSAGLAAVDPKVAARFAAHAECLEVVDWTYRFYGITRDIALDLPGIEQLLGKPLASAADRREVDRLKTRLRLVSMRIGDTLPWIGRRIVRPELRATMHEVSRYLNNVDGVGDAIRTMVRAALEQAWEREERVLLIGHSLGSVIAYDTLCALTREGCEVGRIDMFLTLGSPLGTAFVRRHLGSAGRGDRKRFPSMIRRWVNFAAHGDTTALVPALGSRFAPMIGLGLLESFADHRVYTHFHGDKGLNVHDIYGYLIHPEVAGTIAAWLREGC